MDGLNQISNNVQLWKVCNYSPFNLLCIRAKT